MTVFIRTATVSDLAAVSGLLGVTWHAAYDGIYGIDRVDAITAEWHSPEALKRNLAAPNAEFVLADTGEEIAGMAYASLTDGDVAMLHQLYVLPHWQGSGIGAMLMDEIVACFPEARTLRLEVEEANGQAMKFYLARGFARAGRTSNCGKADSGIPALVLEKALAG